MSARALPLQPIQVLEKMSVSGDFMTLDGERYYAIRNVDQMAPFFISVVSDSDHWLFVASNGGVTAGRVSPETALFSYVTVDRIYDSARHTGCKTLVRVSTPAGPRLWEPFNTEHDGIYQVQRNLYKNTLGDKLLFEEINDDLQLTFRYQWSTSDAFGFVRTSQLENMSASPQSLELIDGLIDVLPAGTPRATQAAGSNLVDAYKWNELDAASGLALFTLFSGISDRAQPCESLRATTIFSTGLDNATRMLDMSQFDAFRRGEALQTQTHSRGVRGNYLLSAPVALAANASTHWQIVAEVEQTQKEAAALRVQLRDADKLVASIDTSVAAGSDELARIMAASDGFQSTAEENVSIHHYANVLFNVMRGGIFDDHYRVHGADFRKHVQMFNHDLATHHRALLDALPEVMTTAQLRAAIEAAGDDQLTRLELEFLPIRFGRRHGDPSRPWNQFAIRVNDAQGKRLLSYQGNWRDIFQNWEALLLSYPEFIDGVIAKFVNASTVDGYNPYRITSEGIDWEVEEPEDPWSYIGYWGDHQIIYLQKLLELSCNFHPQHLRQFLRRKTFCYANVPYRIKNFDALVADAKSTVLYDEALAKKIESRVELRGADGKLVLDQDGQVYQVNLFEKLLVPLLSKLSNLVLDGGIWLNTQRPEWNDANNALVGQGLSMVTLYYMRRYITLLQRLLQHEDAPIEISQEVSEWLVRTGLALHAARAMLEAGPVDAQRRFELLTQLGEAASDYRTAVYAREGFAGVTAQSIEPVNALLRDAAVAIDHSIASNRRDDGLYHAYNLLEFTGKQAQVDTLYPMLEGQVAALSSGAIEPQEAVSMLDALFASDLYRADQHTFMLYPDRALPSFFEKNVVPADDATAIALVAKMQAANDQRIMQLDVNGTWRFAPGLINVDALDAQLHALTDEYPEAVAAAREPLRDLYERVFNHKAFTGRSGGMFGFEGLGSIYWHMVSKLLLAVQESYFAAREQGAAPAICAQLAAHYYNVREGIGFNKSPAEYGAFPTDPYSHTPKHAGAQQPGMTGQVKEEVITRFAELGLRMVDGDLHIDPSLLRRCEFGAAANVLRYLDIADEWVSLDVPADALAFTWCQVPFVYRLSASSVTGVTVTWLDGKTRSFDALSLPADVSQALFERRGEVQRVDVTLPGELLANF